MHRQDYIRHPQQFETVFGERLKISHYSRSWILDRAYTQWYYNNHEARLIRDTEKSDPTRATRIHEIIFL